MQLSRFLIVLRREYLHGLQSRYFLLMTLLAPALTFGMVAAAGMSTSLLGRDEHIVIVDASGQLAVAVEHQLRAGGAAVEALDPFDAWLRAPRRWIIVHDAGSELEHEAAAATSETLRARLKSSENTSAPVDGILVIPKDALDAVPGGALYYTLAGSDPSVTNELRRALGRALERVRLIRRGLTDFELAAFDADVSVENVHLSTTRPPRSSGTLDFMIGFALATLMFVPVLIYGQNIMTGIVQEKTDRVIEILISSISPLALLSGKILGLAALGLTQIAAWTLISGVLASVAPNLAPAGTALVSDSPFLQGDVALFFVLFFLLSYLVSVCAYAMAGSIGSSHKEAQQILMPATSVMTMQWFLVMPVLAHPDSSLACALSLVPLISPVFMFLRLLASEVPAWQVALTVATNLLGIYLLLQATARVFQARILSHGGGTLAAGR